MLILSRPTSCALVQTAYFQAALCAGYAVGAHHAHCPPLLYDCRGRGMGDPPFFKVHLPCLGLHIINRAGAYFFCTQTKNFWGKQDGCPMGERFRSAHVTGTKFKRPVPSCGLHQPIKNGACLAVNQTGRKNFDCPRYG